MIAWIISRYIPAKSEEVELVWEKQFGYTASKNYKRI